MSTELKSTSAFSITRFWGGERGQCVQITQRSGIDRLMDRGYVDMTADEALELAVALWEFSENVREVDEKTGCLRFFGKQGELKNV